MKRIKIKELLSLSPVGSNVIVKGWVRTKRGNKNIVFIALNDGSTINNIQIVVDVPLFEESLLRDITTGACISVKGKLVESHGQGQNIEITAKEINIYGKAMRKHIRFRKKVIRWNLCVRSHTSGSEQILSELYSESVMLWHCHSQIL